MAATLIDSDEIATFFETKLQEAYGSIDTRLRFCTIITSSDEQSLRYIDTLRKESERFGVEHRNFVARDDDHLVNIINGLNADSKINGMLVLSPHPPHIKIPSDELVNMILDSKDVEGLSHNHSGRLQQKFTEESITPPTASAILETLKHYNFSYTNNGASRHAVIINRSPNVGVPLRNMLEHSGMSVFSVDKHTSRDAIYSNISLAELIVTAVPNEGYKIPVDFVREGAAVIAVNSSNIRDLENPSLYEQLTERCNLLTNPKSSVGRITRKITLLNLYRLYQKSLE